MGLAEPPGRAAGGTAPVIVVGLIQAGTFGPFRLAKSSWA